MVAPHRRPRQPRASTVWQVLHDCWDAFRIRHAAGYEVDHGPLPAAADP